MLIEMAVGDAYGAGFEYTSPEFVKANNRLDKYVQHPKWKDMTPGSYTDDTQMSIALAELLLKDRDSKLWSPHDIARVFMATFTRDPRKGYAKGFYDFLKKAAPDSLAPSHETGADHFLMRIRPHSRKNGGAMRAGVMGLLPDAQDVVDRAMFQASLTHATQEGMTAAAAAALLVHYFHYDLGSKEDLPLFLDDRVPFKHPDHSWTDSWHGRRVKSPGTQAVRAAVTAIVKHGSLKNILRQCVDWGGDTDTVATIAMIAASRSREVTQFLPDGLFRNLERGQYGKEFLIALDFGLLQKFPGKNPDESDGETPEEGEFDDLLSLFD